MNASLILLITTEAPKMDEFSSQLLGTLLGVILQQPQPVKKSELTICG